MSNAEELSKLFELKKQGVLTEEEFNQEKIKLIGATAPPTPIFCGGSAMPKSVSQQIAEIKKELSVIKQQIDQKVAKLERSENDEDQDQASELEDIASEIESALDSLNNIENFTL